MLLDLKAIHCQNRVVFHNTFFVWFENGRANRLPVNGFRSGLENNARRGIGIDLEIVILGYHLKINVSILQIFDFHYR